MAANADAVRVVCDAQVRYIPTVRSQRAELPLKLDSPAAARSFFAGCIAEQDPEGESLWIAHLDDQSRCMHLSRHMGDDREVAMPIRTIILDAARLRSSAILLAHNHPSGDSTPSESDLRATRRLAIAATAIECRVADHLVFAGSESTSLRSLGYL